MTHVAQLRPACSDPTLDGYSPFPCLLALRTSSGRAMGCVSSISVLSDCQGLEECDPEPCAADKACLLHALQVLAIRQPRRDNFGTISESAPSRDGPASS